MTVPPRRSLGVRNSEATIVLDSEGDERTDILKAAHPLCALLEHLADLFAREEQECLAFADRISASELGACRFLFGSKARGARARMESWETKHAGELPNVAVEVMSLVEPEYFDDGLHALPIKGSPVVVRESELSSLIALSELPVPCL